MAKRAPNFYKVKRKVDTLNSLAVIVALWTFFWPYPYAAAILSALVIPLCALIVFKRFRGFVQIDEREKSPLPSVFWCFFLPTMALVIHGVADANIILDHSKVWVIVWPLTVGIAVIILVGQPEFGWRNLNQFLPALAMVILAFAYAYSGVITSNCAFDDQNATSFKSKILHKSISSGNKSITYYFELTPWGPQFEVEKTPVERDLYEQMEVGDSVKVLFFNGRWGIPWYIVRPLN